MWKLYQVPDSKVLSVEYVGNYMVFENNGRKIKICSSVLAIIKKYLQCDLKSCEAGGVLIGRENLSNNNLIIEFATEPMPRDTRHRNRFYRKDKGHISFYKNLYEESERVYAYIGEWHTHPEPIPSYSILDFANWQEIGRGSSSNDTQIHLIAGYEGLRLWGFSILSQKVTELTTFMWNEVIFDEEI